MHFICISGSNDLYQNFILTIGDKYLTNFCLCITEKYLSHVFFSYLSMIYMCLILLYVLV